MSFPELSNTPGGVRVAAVSARVGGGARCAGPGCRISAGHGGGFACLETWGLRLAKTPGHGGGASSESRETPPIHLGRHCGVEGCF